MNKTTALVRALRKNGKNVSATSGEESASISGAELLRFLVPAIMAVVSGVAGWVLSTGPWGGFMNFPMAMQTFSMMVTMMIVMFTLMKLVTTMYLSDDLRVLITLPFTEGQITMAKTRIVAENQYLNTACMVIPFTAVWTLMAFLNEDPEKAAMIAVGPGGWLAAALTVLLLPALVLGVVGAVVMVLMRVLRIFRNKNLLKMVGSIVGLVIFYVIYYFFIGASNGSQDGQNAVLKMIIDASNAVNGLFPHAQLIGNIAATGSVSDILILVGVTLAAVGLFLAAAKALYFGAALSMSEASNAKRVLTDEETGRAMRSGNPVNALVKRDRRTILRTPAFLTNGMLKPLGSCLLLSLVMGGTVIRALGDHLMGRAISVSFVFGLSGLVAITAWEELSTASIAFSREGISFSVTRALPIAPETLLRAKRNTALHFGIATTTIPVTLFLIGVCITGKLPVVALLFGPGINLALLWISAEIMILADLSKPDFNWENPGSIRKNTALTLMVIVGIILVLAGAGALAYLWRAKGEFVYGAHVVYGAFTALAIIAAAIFDKYYIRQGTKYLARL